MELVGAILSSVLVVLTGAYLFETRRMREQSERQVFALEAANEALVSERFAMVKPYLVASKLPLRSQSGSVAVVDFDLTNSGMGPAFAIRVNPRNDPWQVQSLPLRDDLPVGSTLSWRIVAPLIEPAKVLHLDLDYDDVFGRPLNVSFELELSERDVTNVSVTRLEGTEPNE